MSDAGLFERRTGRVLAGVLAAGLAVTLFYSVFSDDPSLGGAPSTAADSYSRSALGYRGLVRLLEPELPVVVSRGYSVPRSSPDRPLLLLEPELDGERLGRLRSILHDAEAGGIPMVVVLPKWWGRADPSDPAWVAEVEPRPVEIAERVLAEVLHAPGGRRVVRPAAATGWSSRLPGGGSPSLVVPQLLEQGGWLEPVVSARQGVLVGRVGESSLYLVSDPDLLNNAGIARPPNAEIVHRLLVDHLGARALIVDEGIHGYQAATTLWQVLLDFPLLCFSLQVAALAALAVWAGAVRLGCPQPVPSRLPPGKWTLVDNTARLVALGDRPGLAAEGYFALTVERAAAALHLPPGMESERRLRELDRLGAARGAETGLAELRRKLRAIMTRPEPRRVVALGRALRRWREEVTDGRRR